MIKLVDLLNEIDIPKNKWVTIPASELKDYSEEIYKLIDNAYAPIGGHPNYKSADNVTGREAEAEYEVIDLDDQLLNQKQQVKSLQQQDMMVLVQLNLK